MFDKSLRSYGVNGNGNKELPFLITIRPKLLNFCVTVIKNSNAN